MRPRIDLQLGFALGVIALFVVAGLFGGLIAPYDPTQQDLTQTLKPPAWQADRKSTRLNSSHRT